MKELPETQPHGTVAIAGAAGNLERIQATLPQVAILLCAWHGQRYLAGQMDSFMAQTHSHWQLWVSDDGSKDNTCAILQDYKQKWPAGRVAIHSGPAKGFVANFLSLTCRADIQADYYAWSDQDDIWEADKLERAVRWLETIAPDTPALYCGRTRLVDADNNEIGLSMLFTRPPCFANALMQNIGGGNTMVFNNAARALLCEAGADVPAVSHDWWLYMVVTGCGGKVFYDSVPTLRYRQHNANLVGMNAGWPARFKRIRMLWQGRFHHWNDSNLAALRTLHHRLTPENRGILACFTQARQMRLIKRLVQFRRSGVHRQTFLGNLGLVVAAIFGKV